MLTKSPSTRTRIPSRKGTDLATFIPKNEDLPRLERLLNGSLNTSRNRLVQRVLSFSPRFVMNIARTFWFIAYLIRSILAENSEIAGILHRPIRAISYPSSSNMGIFFALAVPLEDPANSVSLSYFFEANYGLPDNTSLFGESNVRRRRSIDRSTIYSVLISKFESAGFLGQECLLRSICEASEYPLEHNGILGDVFHVVFTPSSSRPEDQLPDGVVEAELKGRNRTCFDYYHNCPLGLFDLIGILL